jgi:hypothetical protein
MQIQPQKLPPLIRRFVFVEGPSTALLSRFPDFAGDINGAGVYKLRAFPGKIKKARGFLPELSI